MTSGWVQGEPGAHCHGLGEVPAQEDRSWCGQGEKRRVKGGAIRVSSVKIKGFSRSSTKRP